MIVTLNNWRFSMSAKHLCENFPLRMKRLECWTELRRIKLFDRVFLDCNLSQSRWESITVNYKSQANYGRVQNHAMTNHSLAPSSFATCLLTKAELFKPTGLQNKNLLVNDYTPQSPGCLINISSECHTPLCQFVETVWCTVCLKKPFSLLTKN